MGRPPAPRLTPLTIVFDLDGTLADTIPDVRAMLGALLAEHGRAPLTRAQIIACFGLGASSFTQRALALSDAGQDPLPASARADIAERFLRAYTTEPPLRSTALPHAADTLRACRDRGFRIAVCTNKPQAAAELLLSHLHLRDLIDGLSGGDSAPARKPDPAHLADAIARAGGTPSRALLVGDSDTDAAAAHAFALPCILIEGGYCTRPLDQLGAALVLPSLAPVPDAAFALDPGRQATGAPEYTSSTR